MERPVARRGSSNDPGLIIKLSIVNCQFQILRLLLDPKDLSDASILNVYFYSGCQDVMQLRLGGDSTIVQGQASAGS